MATIERQLLMAWDDCQCWFIDPNWVHYFSNRTSLVGYSIAASKYHGFGMRFPDIAIPQGTVITAANFRVVCAVTSAPFTSAYSKITGEDNSSPTQFTDLADYQARVHTTEYKYWDILAAWTQDVEYTSPDITNVVQPIINRGDWVSGNYMVIFWDDHDGRTIPIDTCFREVYAVYHSTGEPAILHIEYEAPPPAGGACYGCVIS